MFLFMTALPLHNIHLLDDRSPAILIHVFFCIKFVFFNRNTLISDWCKKTDGRTMGVTIIIDFPYSEICCRQQFYIIFFSNIYCYKGDDVSIFYTEVVDGFYCIPIFSLSKCGIWVPAVKTRCCRWNGIEVELHRSSSWTRTEVVLVCWFANL